MTTPRRLTDIAVKQAATRPERYELHDPSGLSLRVMPTGRKTWIWRYRDQTGTHRRVKLGQYPALPLADARRKLDDAREAVARGRDPAGHPETVEDLIGTYVQRHAVRLRTVREEQRMLRVEILPVLGRKPVQDVTRRDVADLVHAVAERLQAQGRHGTNANRALSVCKR